MRSVVAVIVVVLALPAASGAAAPQPYPVLVERDGVRVYAPRPGRDRWGRCPRGAQTVRRADLAAASRAVLLAIPRLYARSGIDVRGATARSARLGSALWTRWGLARSTCGSRIMTRAVAVGVGFPRVDWSASLSSAVFFVSRVRDGWVVWHQAH